jgi:hypothetical protein
MADGISRDERIVRQRALVLLSVAECVKREGWGDAVAAQLRQAAQDLLAIAADVTDALAAKEGTRIPSP